MTKTRLLFLVILIEGYVVLACELLAIRQMIPFVGSGTETISIIISAVLMPLAIGYHYGGNAFGRAQRRAKESGKKSLSVRQILLRNILCALIILSLGLSYALMNLFFSAINALGTYNRLALTAIYSLIFLVFPVFLLGQTVPLVSHYFSRRKLSEITGRMLFFSTAGSFLGSVFTTIVLMSYLGVHYTVIVTLCLLALLGLLLSKRLLAYEPIVCALVAALMAYANSAESMKSLNIVSNNAYNTISIHVLPRDGGTLMSVNRAFSSIISPNPKKRFPYVAYIEKEIIAPIATGKEPPRDILILGAGGFTMGLADAHNRYTYVDIDPDLKAVAESEFLKQELLPNKQFIAASARAFVKDNPKRYDLVILDTFTNIMSIPMETTTREYLLDVKKLMKPDGVLVANVIASPTFQDIFTTRYDNTFASVFPAYTRQIIGSPNVWNQPRPHTEEYGDIRNILYIFVNSANVEDDRRYTDDKNTYSLDR